MLRIPNISKNPIMPKAIGSDQMIAHITPDSQIYGTDDDVQALVVDASQGFVLPKVDYKYKAPIKRIPNVGFQFLQGNYFDLTLPYHNTYMAISCHMVVSTFKQGVSPETVKDDGSNYSYDTREEMVYTGLIDGSYMGFGINTREYTLCLDWENKNTNSTTRNMSRIRSNNEAVHGSSTHTLGVYFDTIPKVGAERGIGNDYGGSSQFWANGRIIQSDIDNGVPMIANRFVVGRAVYGIVHEVMFYARTESPADKLMPDGMTNQLIQNSMMDRWNIIP